MIYHTITVTGATVTAMAQDLIKEIAEYIAEITNLTATDITASGSDRTAYLIEDRVSPIAWHIYAGESGQFYRVSTGIKYSTTGTRNLQTGISNGGATTGGVTIAYETGINSDIAIWLLSYGTNTVTTQSPIFYRFNATKFNDTDTDIIMCAGNATTTFAYVPLEDTTYYANNSITTSNNVIRLKNTEYAMLVPFTFPNTPYIADNLFYCSMGGWTAGNVIQDGTNRYSVLYTDGNMSVLMRIE